ncbi:MerR family DNA-binding transcriptional regulator [Acetobacteraceae bacterium H6797]|nr:MerR family DNA-binding transcriptional regulator [Acetobacteraceae bacterium H6797]
MKIGELAKLTGLNASKIRFYEAAGLIGTIERGPNGYRRYPPEAVTLLGIITSAQRAGFTLDQIRYLMPAGSHGWRHAELVVALREKVAEIDGLQAQLAQNKAQLLAVIDGIENRPEGIVCTDNKKRVFNLLGLAAGDSGDHD